MTKSIVTILFLLAVFLSIAGCQDSSRDSAASAIQISNVDSYMEQKYGEFTSLANIDRILPKFLNDVREDSISSKPKNSEAFAKIALSFIKHMQEHESYNYSMAIKNYCLLYQYLGVANAEYLSEIMNAHFINRTKDVIDVLSSINKLLFPEFQNEAFLNYLFQNVCEYPQSMTEADGFNREEENTRIRSVLKSLQTKENEEIIVFLLNEIFAVR